jgi:muramoyltetrapeptide carboxypeptidase
MAMFADPEVALVMPASGGIGAGHLVDLLDYRAIRAHPKLFTGFSDPSVLNNSILAARGCPACTASAGSSSSAGRITMSRPSQPSGGW